MIIKNIKVTAFGRLKDWQSPELSSGLTVFCGKNEAGKSTIFNLIVTLLYGWKPVKGNEYIPWDGESASISGIFIASDSKEYEISRRLRGQASSGNLVQGGQTVQLANNALTQLDFMSREVFREIYALGLDQLRFPDNDTWQKLQDQLLGGQYASFLRATSAVLKEIEGAASRLWRSDNRGNSDSKVLNSNINELNKKIQMAKDNEEKLHQLESELEQLKASQEQLKEERIRLKGLQNRYEHLIPVSRSLQRLGELWADAGDIVRYDSISDQADQERINLQDEMQELEGKRDKLQEKIEKAESAEAAYDESDRKVMAAEWDISKLTRASGQLQTYMDRKGELEDKLKLNKNRLVDRAGQILIGGWQDGLAEPIKSVDELELNAAINEFGSSSQQRNEIAAKLEGLKSVPSAGGFRLSKKTPLLAVIILLAGIAGALWGGPSPLGIGAAVLGAAGIILLVFWYLSANRDQEEANNVRIKEMEAQYSDLENKCGSIRQQVRDALQGLKIPESTLDKPDAGLMVDIKELKGLLGEQEALLSEIEISGKHLQQAEAETEAILRKCDLHPASGLLKNIGILEQRLSEAEKRRQRADSAEKERSEATAELEAVESKLELQGNKLQHLQDGLEGLPGTSWEDRFAELKRRRQARGDAESLQRDLQSSYPDLNTLKKEIEKDEALEENGAFTDEAKERVESQLKDIDDELNQISEQIGKVQTELSSRQQQERLDDLQGRLYCLQEEMAEVKRERDRLVLLKSILSSADQIFREEHQPDVLKKAGEYLGTITGGRYKRLLVRDEGSGLELQSDDYDLPVEAVHPLSRGTLEQVYLALRLALVEHLDDGKEKLPLFLDEVMVNFDGIRRGRVLEIIEGLSEKRQVFLFTCHAWLADSLNGKGEIVEI